MKNILIIQETMGGGGAERVLTVLLKHIDRTNFRVTLALLYPFGVFMKDIPSDIEVIPVVPELRSLLFRLMCHSPRRRFDLMAKRIRKAVGNRKFDTTVSFLEGPSSAVHSRLLDLAPRNISWVHTGMQENHWTAKIFPGEKTFYTSLHKIIFVSESARDSFLRLFGYTDVPLQVIHNPVDVNGFNHLVQAERVRKETFTIVSVGRLVPIKRHDRLILTASLLRDRGLDFEMWILGTGPLESSLREQIESLGLKERVKLLGFRSNPFPYMKVADLFCLTSDAEGYPMVVAESLALGVPVVTTPVCGVSEMLGDTAGIISSPTPEALADAIESLILDGSQLEHIRSGAQKVGERLDVNTTMKHLESILLNA